MVDVTFYVDAAGVLVGAYVDDARPADLTGLTPILPAPPAGDWLWDFALGDWSAPSEAGRIKRALVDAVNTIVDDFAAGRVDFAATVARIAFLTAVTSIDELNKAMEQNHVDIL